MRKGEYQACIDHCIIKNSFILNSVKLFSKLLSDDENLSDHNHMSIIIPFQS